MKGSSQRKGVQEKPLSALECGISKKGNVPSTQRFDLSRKQDYQHEYIFTYSYSFYLFVLSFENKYVRRCIHALGI